MIKVKIQNDNYNEVHNYNEESIIRLTEKEKIEEDFLEFRFTFISYIYRWKRKESYKPGEESRLETIFEMVKNFRKLWEIELLNGQILKNIQIVDFGEFESKFNNGNLEEVIFGMSGECVDIGRDNIGIDLSVDDMIKLTLERFKENKERLKLIHSHINIIKNNRDRIESFYRLDRRQGWKKLDERKLFRKKIYFNGELIETRDY